MGRCFELELKPYQLLVLLALCDHANDNGGSCYPSKDLIAHKCGHSSRHVRRAVASLGALGLLKPVAYKHGGRGHATHYQIDLYGDAAKKIEKDKRHGKADSLSPFRGKKPDVSNSQTLTSATEKADISGMQRLTPASAETPLDPSIEPSMDPCSSSAAKWANVTDDMVLRWIDHRVANGEQIRRPNTLAEIILKQGRECDLQDILKLEADRERSAKARRGNQRAEAHRVDVSPPNWLGTPAEAVIQNARKHGAEVPDSWFSFEGLADDGGILISVTKEVREFIAYYYPDLFSHHPDDNRPVRLVERRSQAAAA